MLLVIDTGNSDITFALYKNKEWIHHWRIPSKAETTKEVWQYRLVTELLELGYKTMDIHDAVVSSVVPHLNQSLMEMLEDVLGEKPLMVNATIYPKLNIKIAVARNEIGTDLVANAVAAYDRFKEKCVVVDFGTALTFTTIDEDGSLLGVAIAPGLKTAIRSLFDNTAQLPEVPLELPDSVLGKDTIHAIQSGILIGYTGMVRHMISKIKSEVGSDCKVIATGGLSSILTSLKPDFDDIDWMLTMKGLVLILEQVNAE